MPRPPITWIHQFRLHDSWAIVTRRLDQPRRKHPSVTYASRVRLANLVESLGRPNHSQLPRLVTRPLPIGWCAYPDPERSTT